MLLESSAEVAKLVKGLQDQGLTLALAESLTGGALTATFVEIPGVSAVLRGGACTYATDAKASVLGVSGARLTETGPVDGVVAAQMASGACRLFGADVALSTTGVAGPGPSDGKDAGTVWIAIAGALGAEERLLHLEGERDQVRAATIRAALALLGEYVAAGAS